VISKSAFLILLFLVFTHSSVFAKEECYMYTPYQYQRDGGDYRIGPYPSRSSCKDVNDDNFGGSGRCDCTEIADPSTGYVPAGGVSGGYSRQRAQQEADMAQQQEYEANLQRMRAQQQEQERQRQIEEKAKRDAEARRQEIEWKQKKAELMSSLKGGASGDFKLKGGGEEVQLKPKGELQTEEGSKYIFGLPLKKYENAMVIKTRTLEPSQAVPPSSEKENQRRALWLYAKAASAKDLEEAAFLSQQADEAAQGHPLLVEVPPADKTPEVSKANLEQYEKLATVFEKDRVTLDMVQQKQVNIEKKRALLENRFSELKEKIQAQEQQPASPKEEMLVKEGSEPEKAPEVKQEPEAKEEPKAEKLKGGEDLLAELQALEKEIQETDKEATRLTKEEGKAKQALDKSQQKLDTFLKKT